MRKILLALVAGLAATAAARAMGPADPGQPLALAMKESVQKELELSETEITSIKKLHAKAVKGELQGEAQKELGKALSQKQLKRLKEISVQVLGGAALVGPEVQKELGLDAAQVRKIAEAWKLEEAQLQRMLAVSRFRSAEAMRAYILNHRKKVGEKLLELLSGEQKAALKKLRGKAFDTRGLDS